MKDYPKLNREKNERLVRRKPDSAERSSLKLMLAVVGLILVALIFVQQRVEYIRTERHVKKLLLEKRKIESIILPLKLEERYLTQLHKIEKVAERDLKLQYPRASQIVEVEVGDSGEKRQ